MWGESCGESWRRATLGPRTINGVPNLQPRKCNLTIFTFRTTTNFAAARALRNQGLRLYDSSRPPPPLSSRFSLLVSSHDAALVVCSAARALPSATPSSAATRLNGPYDAITSSSGSSTVPERWVWESIPAFARSRWERDVCAWVRWFHHRSHGADGLPGRKDCDDGWTGVYGTKCMGDVSCRS